MNETTSFARRIDENGTHESICRGCFEMVASVAEEAELAMHERYHNCDPVRLYQLREDAHFHGALARWLSEIVSSRMSGNRAKQPPRYGDLRDADRTNSSSPHLDSELLIPVQETTALTERLARPRKATAISAAQG